MELAAMSLTIVLQNFQKFSLFMLITCNLQCISTVFERGIKFTDIKHNVSCSLKTHFNTDTGEVLNFL